MRPPVRLQPIFALALTACLAATAAAEEDQLPGEAAAPSQQSLEVRSSEPREENAAVPSQEISPPLQVGASQLPEGALLSPGERIPPDELEAFVDGLVSAAVVANRIAGVTVAAVQNGEVVLAKGYGFADLEAGRRVEPDTTLFRIGSITKTFTWIEIMRLVEMGRLSLDDPINQHLPEELQIPEQGFDEPIRVRDLMTHQPGFEDRALGVLFVRDPGKIKPLNEALRETRPNRVRPPGELSSYSNYGTALAGAIVEHHAGRPWQDVIEDHILGPLRMTRTTGREPYPARAELPAPMPESLAADLSRGYRIVGADPRPQPFEHVTQFAPAGAMSSTASDMARYMLMLLGDGTLGDVHIFGPEAARAFRTPMTSWPREIGGWSAGFAEIPMPGGFRSYGHDGATLVFYSSMSLLPELDLGVFVSTNTAGGAALTQVLTPLLVQHFYGAPLPAPLEGRPELRAELAGYAGQYGLTRRRHSGLEGFLMRLQALPVGVSAEGYLTAVLPIGPGRFVPTETPGLFQNADSRGHILFERRDGRLTLSNIGFTAERLTLLKSPSTLILVVGLAALAAFGTLLGLFRRFGRQLPSTAAEAHAGRLQAATALLWLGSFGSLVFFAITVAGDVSTVIYRWPTPSILAFSTLALLASIATAVLLGLLPAVWGGEGGWTRWRKTRLTAAALAFAACGAMLLTWGALQPWNP